jgi:hypothetical protein
LPLARTSHGERHRGIPPCRREETALKSQLQRFLAAAIALAEMNPDDPRCKGDKKY